MKRIVAFSIAGFVISSVFSLFFPFVGTLMGVVLVALLFARTSSPRAVALIGIATVLGAMWPVWVFFHWLDGMNGVAILTLTLAAFFAFTTFVGRWASAGS